MLLDFAPAIDMPVPAKVTALWAGLVVPFMLPLTIVGTSGTVFLLFEAVMELSRAAMTLLLHGEEVDWVGGGEMVVALFSVSGRRSRCRRWRSERALRIFDGSPALWERRKKVRKD
jgi:hypothetical protein